MKKVKKIHRLYICIAICTALFLSSCAPKEDDTTNDINAPAIPPLSTFKIDFDQFPSSGSIPKPANSGVDARAIVLSNHTQAAAQILVWQTLLTVGLFVPVAAFAESFNHTPTLRADGTFIWSYSVANHTAELQAQINGADVNWEMYLSKSGEYEDFNWYSGVSKLDGSSGTWTLRKSPTDPVDLLGIEWHRDVLNDTADITYTNIEPGGAENGGYIVYGKTTDTTYNAFYDIYYKSQDNLVEIEWHLENHNGRIKNEAVYNDTDWHYWDENLDDTTAP
ncbi:MAG: hypothetical protein R3240_01860 [Gammaproteobacteria bacterium]|nr:hypothetical protein [Gammaproteobacteria bacterium]